MDTKSEELHSTKENTEKSKNVRFASAAPETIEVDNVNIDATEEEIVNVGTTEEVIVNVGATEEEIKAEIQCYLPSNTLYRRKKSVYSADTYKSMTLPGRRTSIPCLSHNLFRTQSFTIHDVPDEAERKSKVLSKYYEIPTTEAERLEELQTIRDLPIPISEKKTYRNAILNAMISPQIVTKSQKKSFFDISRLFSCCKAFKIELWKSTLKKIEGQFGTGVVSYFVLLRWLVFLNFLIFTFYFFVIILPYSSFDLLPRRKINIAPNTSVFTEEFIHSFPKTEIVPLKKQTKVQSASINISDDLLSNLGSLLDNYLPEKGIVDITARYGKGNYTSEERNRIAIYCEERYKNEMKDSSSEVSTLIQDFLQGTGWMESTVLFLGYYSDRDLSFFGLTYILPIAFLAVLVVSFFLSLFLMIQYSSSGIRENVLTRKSKYKTFSNILFCSWDFCIEDKKTAAVRHKSILCEIKSNLADEYRQLEISQWSPQKKINVYILRAIFHLLVLGSLFGCFYLIYVVVNFQLEKERQNALTGSGIYTLCIQFLSPIVITGFNIVMPIIFNNIGRFEMYNSHTQVNLALFRIVFLRLASVFVLVFTLHQQITCEPKDMCKAGMSDYCRSPICWETYVGQQLYRLVLTDFFVYVFMFLGYDLPRDLIATQCNCKLAKVMGRQVFDIPSQVLSLVYSQTLCWLGIFYSPLLPGITVLKFIIVFYIKKIVVLRYCTPAPVLYKAARNNSIFMTILMMSFFVITVIHCYALTSMEPSPACSPFRQYVEMMKAVPDALYVWSSNLVKILDVLFSPFFFIPAYLVLSLAIYYYWTVVAAQKEMKKVLKSYIVIEGHDKQFLLQRLAEAAKVVNNVDKN